MLRTLKHFTFIKWPTSFPFLPSHHRFAILLTLYYNSLLPTAFTIHFSDSESEAGAASVAVEDRLFIFHLAHSLSCTKKHMRD